jgi:hypothetical protein
MSEAEAAYITSPMRIFSELNACNPAPGENINGFVEALCELTSVVQQCEGQIENMMPMV